MTNLRTEVLFDRFFSAKGLNEDPTIIWNCERELIDDTHLSIKKDQADYERIFKLPIAKAASIKDLVDIVLELEVGLEYTGTSAEEILSPGCYPMQTMPLEFNCKI